MMDNFFFKILRRAFYNSDGPTNKPTNKPINKATSKPTNEDTNETELLQRTDQTVDDRLQSIMSQINISILNKVHGSQSLAYEYDKSGIENTECCVCLEENIKLSPLLCKHQICPDCINRLIQYKWTKCPLCFQDLQKLDVYKFWTIIVKLGKTDVALVYLPPIHNVDDDSWLDHELFINCHTKKKAFMQSLNRIKKENYVVIFNDSMTRKFIIPILGKVVLTEA